MPTLISRGTASARAFGLTGSNKGQLYTQTFTSNGIFNAMPGVTNITTLVGQGGTAQGDYPNLYQNYYITRVIDNNASGPSPLPIPWATIADQVVSVYNAFNAGGDQSGFSWDTLWYLFYPDQTYGIVNLGGNSFPYYTIPGGWQIIPTGNVQYPPVGDAYYPGGGSYGIQGSYYEPGSDGTDTSAFGYTFPAATLSGSYPFRPTVYATPVTYNNIAVSPGINYPIVVGAGGFVSISYIIP